MIIESSNEFLLNNDDSKYPILIETVILKENVKESCLISDKSLTIGHVEIISESNEYNMSIRSLSKEFPIGICLQNYEFYPDFYNIFLKKQQGDCMWRNHSGPCSLLIGN